jgi:hypothetical protein
MFPNYCDQTILHVEINASQKYPNSSSHQPIPISFGGIEFQPQKILAITTRETYTQLSNIQIPISTPETYKQFSHTKLYNI